MKSCKSRLQDLRRRCVGVLAGEVVARSVAVKAFISLFVVSVSLFGFACVGQAYAQDSSDKNSHTFSITAGSLDAALSAFSAQSGVVPQFAAKAVKGKTTKGLNGAYTASEGLRRLLAGTGLQVRASGSGGLRIVATAPGDATVLQPMTVQGDAIGTHDIPIETLKRNLAKDMADIFANDPSVIVGGGARNAQRLYVRGVESTNLNVTIDGAKQGGSLHQHRGDIGSIDPSLLKRVAVQTGSSADAGPGALGGSIRFETVDAQDMLQPGKLFGARLHGAYGSGDRSWTGGATAYGSLQDLGILANFSTTDRNDYRTGGGGDADNTGGEDYDYFVKLSMLEQAGHSLRFSVDRKEDSGLYVWGGAGSDMGYAVEGTDPISVNTARTSVVADYRFNPGNQLIDSRINLYFNENSVENEDADSTYTADTFGGDVRNTFHFKLGAVQTDLTAGADGVFATNISEVSNEDTSNKSHNLGFYLQNRMSYGPLRFSFGARVDSYDAEYGDSSIDGTRLSPNVGMEYDLIPQLTAFVNYGEAVRASGIIPGSWMANINDDTVFDVDSPESSQRAEGGLRFRTKGLFLANDALQIEGTYFNSRLKNVITAQGGRGGIVQAIMNSETLISKGWEIRFGWGFEKYDTSLGYTHVTTRDADGHFATVSRRFAASSGDRLVWDNRIHVLDSLTLGYTLSYVARLEDVPEGDYERPGYVLHGVQAEWEPEFLPGLGLTLAVHNLFDRAYNEQTSIMDSEGNVLEEPGRDIRFGVTYQF